MDSIKRCNNCNSQMEPTDRYCLMCGYPASYKNVNIQVQMQSNRQSTDISVQKLQNAIRDVFYKTKVTKIFYKYAMAFVIYYVTYLLLCRITEFYEISLILYKINSPMYYLFLLGLIVLFSKKNYIALMSLMGAKVLSEIIFIVQNDWSLSIDGITRIILSALVIAFAIVEYNKTNSNVVKTCSCPRCNTLLPLDSSFCLKCGIKVR